MIPTVAPEILKAAMDTYAMERALQGELHEAALESAIAAGIRAAEQRVVDRIARQAATFAEEMSSPEGEPQDPFAVALSWFATKLREEKEVDPSGPYTPAAGDVVEVTVVGPVVTWHDVCKGCGQENDKHNAWSVTDDRTGLEFSFPGNPAEGKAPQVRVLARSSENKGEK